MEKILIAEKIEFLYSGEKYSSCKSDIFTVELKEKFVYRFETGFAVCGKARAEIFIAFKNNENKELAKLHIENGSVITTVLGTAYAEIQFWASSEEKATVCFEDARLIPLHEEKKREVVLAAVAIKYTDASRTLEKNIKEAIECIDNAAKENPDLIVLTEHFYARDSGLPKEETALHLDGEIVKKFRDKAKEYNTYIAFSNYAFLENGNISNLGVLIDRKGEIAGTYSKTHYTMGELLAGLEPGDGPRVFECDFGKVGFAICWDLFFPEFARLYHLEGVDVIINPSAGFEAQRNSERAKETGAYIVSSGIHTLADSAIFAPDGEVLSYGDEKGYAAAKVDLNKEFYVDWLSASSSSTRKNVFKYERVPELYK